MDETTLKTSGSYSSFASMCSDVEARIVGAMASGPKRNALLERARDLREAFKRWPQSPPSATERTLAWTALLALEENAVEMMNA